MPRYRSRMSKTAVKKKAPRPRAKKTGAKISTGGQVATAPQAFEGTGSIGAPESFSEAPKPISQGSAIATGGQKISYDHGQGGMSSSDTSCAQGGGLSSGGALKTGGRLRTGGKMDPDKTLQFVTADMSYPEAIHTLGSMDDEAFYVMQGIGGAFLNNIDHPLRDSYLKHFGGGFAHPSDISRVATMDILKADNPRKLAQMLHSEWRDRQRGVKVGGGLLDSLKNVFKKGVSGLKKGTKGAYHAGKKLHSALEKGIDIAARLSGPLSDALGSKAGERITKGVNKALDAAQGLQKVLNVAEEAVRIVDN